MSSASTVATLHRSDCLFLQVALPGRSPENAGVLLLDVEADRLHVRLRRDWSEMADEEEAEVLELFEHDIQLKANELGADAFLRYLEGSASNILRVTDREPMQVADFEARLRRLYKEYVNPKVLPYRTHLPVFTLRAAAGKFGGEMEVEPEEWEETPPELRVTTDMFLAHVTGRSMEPRIPDDSLCVFRANVVGTRQGKLLLIENYGLSENQGRYTVKRYRSEKQSTEEGWRHTKIVMEPLNPEFERWELEPGDFRVIGEFVRVLY